jgi:hypothetical protein
MGVRILHDPVLDVSVLYCSTTDWAFGPLFSDSDDHDGTERAEAFLRWLMSIDEHVWRTYRPVAIGGRRDPRQLDDPGLEAAYGDWRAQEADQWKKEEELDTERMNAFDE